GDILLNGVRKSAVGNGFNEDAFVPFENILCAEYIPLNSSDFKPLTTSVFARNISVDSLAGKYSVINTLDVPVEKVAEVKESLKGTREFGADFFDVKSLNGSIADTLSDDFNYIGFVCGGIVFIFLWISLGRLELAVISFLPMAVSWIWILGIMGMTGINFNIVNLILATFIFGQGDDYTIFMTEGLIYEYAYRKKILASYKNSIIVSALIMFIGIGALIFSKHPAMRSLGEVTVVGMLSVVLMAYLFPPLIFNFLVKKNGKFRKYPITLRTLFKGTKGLDDISRVMGRYIYKGAEVERNARKCLKEIREDKDEKSLPPLLKKMHEESSVVIDARENQGEIALLMALRYPDTDFMAVVADEDHKKLLEGCADGFVNNLTVSL
ncbi:MAG: MMPL family transporter, partial [Muribaculaceae bacterium]|nr:MMPL family transporter [Muribaculaceae bacterium]